MPVHKNADASVSRNAEKRKPKTLRRDRAAAKLKKAASEVEPQEASMPMGVELDKVNSTIRARLIKAWNKTENGQNRSALRKYYYILSNLKSNQLQKLDSNAVIFHRTLSDKVNKELRKAQVSTISGQQFSELAFLAPEKPKSVEAKVVILELGEHAPPKELTYIDAIERPIYIERPGWYILPDVKSNPKDTWGGAWGDDEIEDKAIKAKLADPGTRTFFIRNRGVLETHPYHAGNNISIYMDSNQYAKIGSSVKVAGLLGELGIYPDMTIELIDRLPGGMPRNHKQQKKVYKEKAAAATKQHNLSKSTSSSGSSKSAKKKGSKDKSTPTPIYRVKPQKIYPEDEQRCQVCDYPRSDHVGGNWCTREEYRERKAASSKVVAVNAPLPKEKANTSNSGDSSPFEPLSSSSDSVIIEMDDHEVIQIGGPDADPPALQREKLALAVKEVRKSEDAYSNPDETYNFRYKRQARVPVCLHRDVPEAFRDDNFQAFLEFTGLTLIGPMINILSLILFILSLFGLEPIYLFITIAVQLVKSILIKFLVSKVAYPITRASVERLGAIFVSDEIWSKDTRRKKIFSWRTMELLTIEKDHQEGYDGAIIVGRKLVDHAVASCEARKRTSHKMLKSCLKILGFDSKPFFSMKKETIEYRHIHTDDSVEVDRRAISFSTSEIKEYDAGMSVFLFIRKAGFAKYHKNVWISLKLATQILAMPKIMDVSLSSEDLYSRVVFAISNSTYVNVPQAAVHEKNVITNTVEYVVWACQRQRQNAYCNGFPVSKKEPATFI
jgi:hypothetical protein